jgi:hypothetical protein
MTNNYDIFISYHREDGAQYARILQMQLEKTGYRVFLDYDELKRDRFGDDITRAIQSAPIFLMVLTPLYLKRCKEEGNWIKREIDLAIEGKKHFVPLNPDRKFNGIPEGLSPQIADVVENYQHSIVDFGQTLKVTYSQMVENQIKPIVKPRRRLWGLWNNLIVVCLVAIGVGLFEFFNDNKIEKMRSEMEKRYANLGLYLSPDLTERQLSAIDNILSKMVPVKKDSLWMSQFEFTKEQWYGIKDEECDNSQKDMPMTNVSFGEISMLVIDLSNMTNLNVALPSVEEWEYAAHGGANNETTLYVGDDDVNKVAWYKDNSGGQVHASDGQQGKEANILDLYDMSGNVCELCNSAFSPNTDNSPYTICGGNYLSPASEVTVTSRAPFGNNSKSNTVGFRVVIKKY